MPATPGRKPEAWKCDLIVLAVKPQQMKEAVKPLVPPPGGQLVVSIAAGLRLESLSRWGAPALVRTMPNTPALIGAGVTGLYAPPEVDAAERLAADRVMRTVGGTFWSTRKTHGRGDGGFGQRPGLSVFLFIEALQDAARELGFTPDRPQMAIGNHPPGRPGWPPSRTCRLPKFCRSG